jgi:DNA-directed RNA polymerase subunit F
MEIKGSVPVTISEAKDMLAKRKSEQAELGYEQNQALEHAERFAKFDADKAKKLVEKLSKIGLSREMAVKVVDVRPATAASLKAIVSKDKIELSEEDAEKILKELA